MNQRMRYVKNSLHPVICVLLGAAAGAALGGLDCILQGQSIQSPSSFWRWSMLVLLIPAVFALAATCMPFSFRLWLFAVPIPQTFQASTMTIQNVVGGVAIDAVLYRHIFLVSIVYFFICFVPAAIGAAVRWLWSRKPTFPSGCCESCGYNLTGNVSGCCPECGTDCTRNYRSLRQ